MAANEEALGALHNALVITLTDLLKGTELPAEIDEETGAILNEATIIPPSAAILTVIAKVLKDNNITSAPSKDNALGKLQEEQKAREEARKARRAQTVRPGLEPDSLDLMDGLPKH